ncbi:6-pyruvoyltetrahydropterin/6-carboxytetrahydropterin synthase [Chishuiella changwenlii]|uniref:6-carboxy-5,6,7,8-tetrahydropterin synthase n=1 Tax=Chishuiella changwenlii TaxID=1434701 RepID=A0A1M6VY49_9FLAO|nr:6-carboxytetrahydropterin synthase [Chishuiella changwenlii]GGE89637.1 6-carboxy-5,6,7,8-tetrahydropterin synthase [Chishuiella changwenlii]SHK86265.1 6-pyruvoyltetrahydropterin/6-carboxytetrahydropterin synthase [Chishuiella changwenlii]
MKVTVNRKAHFNAAHRLFNKDWSDEKNFEVFGKCSYPNYHGHNYEIIVAVKGDVDPTTGFVMNLDLLRSIIEEEVEEYLDHKNLNIDIKEFQSVNPSAENIVILIWNKIRAKLAAELELKVTLYETPRNFVEYTGE